MRTHKVSRQRASVEVAHFNPWCLKYDKESNPALNKLEGPNTFCYHRLNCSSVASLLCQEGQSESIFLIFAQFFLFLDFPPPLFFSKLSVCYPILASFSLLGDSATMSPTGYATAQMVLRTSNLFWPLIHRSPSGMCFFLYYSHSSALVI